MQDQLAEFFRHHFDAMAGMTIEIRAFRATGGGKKVQQFLATPEAAAEFVRSLPKDLEVYYGVNPRRGNDGTKDGVAMIVCLHADVDDKHFDNDPEQSREACYSLGVEPSEVVRSGNGWQAIWLLEVPVDKENTDRVEALAKRLYHALGGLDAVQDVSRIFRVPGTYNNKDPKNPKRVELVATSEAVTTLEEMERLLPVLPPQDQPAWREISSLLGDEQRPSLDYLRLLLGYIDPCKPYNEYIVIWGAVAYYYPDEDGLALVDEWSSEARAANGQFSSPRTQPEKHRGFRRLVGRVATIGTLIHYAMQGGYVIPKVVPLLPTVGMRKRQAEEAGPAAKLDDLPNPTYLDLPYWAQRVYDYLGPLTELLDRDFITQMAVVGFSQFWPGLRVEGLPLNLWGLGVAASGSGKNVITDTIRELFCTVPGHAPLYTSGSPEGILRALDGEGKSLFVYLDEFGDFLSAMEKDYMAGTSGMLCSLHDGRPVAHRLSKTSIQIEDPFAALIATTTPEKVLGHLRQEDLSGGLLSRFWITLPKVLDRRVRKETDPALRAEIAEALQHHRQDLACVRRIRLYQDIPDEQVDLERVLGMNTGHWRTFEEEVRDPRIARGRHIPRFLVLATLLELMKARPAVVGNELLVTRESCQLAYALARRAIVDQERLVARLASSEDGRNLDRLRRAVEGSKDGLTRSDLLRKTHLKAQELGRLLSVLIDSREACEEEDEHGRVVYRKQGGQPALARRA